MTVTSAIEGLEGVPALSQLYSDQTLVVITTIFILTLIFSIQRYGTGFIGKVFGPVMLLWFASLGVTGLINTFSHLEVLRAFNPYYAIELLLSPDNKKGIFILGSIFLATTGAEALYSDLGHVGRGNIYVSWPFVKACIMLSYLGQGAWILDHQSASEVHNPFFASIPSSLSIFAVTIATLAAIIASQALISGSFTLVSEAIRLKIFPSFKVTYPGQNLGQLYIPVINWSLWLATVATVLHFQTSAHMEAAYGLAITITMLMTTILLTFYLIRRGIKASHAHLLMSIFALIEIIFFIASAVKFMHGGYVVVILAALILSLMYIWYKANQIIFKYVKSLDLRDFKDQLGQLRKDEHYDLFQTNVIYLTNRMDDTMIDRSILYSILDKRPKRARVYWFVNVKVTDEPYTAEYKADMMGTDYIVRLELFLGFRMRQEVPRYLRTIVNDLMSSGRLPKQDQTYTITPGRQVGDFRFIILEERLAKGGQMNPFDRFILQTKAAIKHFTASPSKWFGLQFSEVTTEIVPIVLSDVKNLQITEAKSSEIIDTI